MAHPPEARTRGPGAEATPPGRKRKPCSGNRLREPAAGRARWTLELLADAMVKLTEHESLSHETMRRRSSDKEIARAVAVGGSTVYRTKRRFVEGNLERAHRGRAHLPCGRHIRRRPGMHHMSLRHGLRPFSAIR